MTDAAAKPDPNAPYVPVPYPMMVYRDRSDYRLVNTEDEYEDARKEGYLTFTELPEHPADDLDVMSHAQLVEKLVAMLRAVMNGRSRQELIEAIRVNEEIAKHNRETAVAAQEHHDEAMEAAKAELKAADGDESDEELDVLYGSSILPAIVEIGDFDVQLGALVHASYVESGLSVDQWNDLATATREDRLQSTIERLADDEDAFDAEIPNEAIIDPAHEVVSEQGRIASGQQAPGSPEATGISDKSTTLNDAEHQADLEDGEDTVHHHTPGEDLLTDAETVADIREVETQASEAQAAARGDEFGIGPDDTDQDGPVTASDPEEVEKAQIRADLTALGVPFHHKAGLPKLRKALEEATAPKDA